MFIKNKLRAITTLTYTIAILYQLIFSFTHQHSPALPDLILRLFELNMLTVIIKMIVTNYLFTAFNTRIPTLILI